MSCSPGDEGTLFKNKTFQKIIYIYIYGMYVSF